MYATGWLYSKKQRMVYGQIDRQPAKVWLVVFLTLLPFSMLAVWASPDADLEEALAAIDSRAEDGGEALRSDIERLEGEWYWLSAAGKHGTSLSLRRWDDKESRFVQLGAWDARAEAVIATHLIDAGSTGVRVCAHTSDLSEDEQYDQYATCWVVDLASAGDDVIRSERRIAGPRVEGIGASVTEGGNLIVGVLERDLEHLPGQSALKLYALGEQLEITDTQELSPARDTVQVLEMEMVYAGETVMVVQETEGIFAEGAELETRICVSIVNGALVEIERVCRKARSSPMCPCLSVVRSEDGLVVVRRYLPEWVEQRRNCVAFDASEGAWMETAVKALPEVAVDCQMELVTGRCEPIGPVD